MWGGLEYALGVYAGFFRTSSADGVSGEFCYEDAGSGQICVTMETNQFESTAQSNVQDVCIIWCTAN